MAEKINDRSGKSTVLYKTHVGPPVPEKCPECGSPLHIAGPMWNGPIHDPHFVDRILEHLYGDEDKYGTSTRMKGMLTVTKEVEDAFAFLCQRSYRSLIAYMTKELAVPFYFTPSRVASFFHCICPSLDEIASVDNAQLRGASFVQLTVIFFRSALLHAGHQVSRSHAVPGSLKTTAARRDLYDVYRSWVKKHPVKMEKIPPNSPARTLLQKEPKYVMISQPT